MQNKEGLLDSVKGQLRLEKQLQAQMDERFEVRSSRNNRIVFLESLLLEIDVMLESLKRLWTLAQGDSGGSRVAGLFLINLYNGDYANFSLRELNVLDHSYWEDAMNVLKLDRINYKELYEYIDGGEELMQALIDRWGSVRE